MLPVLMLTDRLLPRYSVCFYAVPSSTIYGFHQGIVDIFLCIVIKSASVPGLVLVLV